jgi:hypothetical protein
MAYLFRLIAFTLLSLFASGVHAAIPATSQTGYNCGFAPGYHATVLAALQGWGGLGLAHVTPPYVYNAGSCVANIDGVPRVVSSGSTSTLYSCPANSTLSGTVCNCNSGHVQEGSACVVQQTPEEQHCASINGSPVKASWTTTDPSLSTRTICMSNAGYSCTATVEGDICGASGSGGSWLCHGSGVSGGSGGGTTCTPSPEPDAPPPVGAPETDWPDAPPPGMCPGTINGVSVNVPCSNTSTSNTKTEQTDDGAGNVTSKSETKNTTCNAAGSCTTTVTTTTTVNGGSPMTSTKTTTEGKGQFCAGNPGSKECGDGDGSSFGGNCESSFVCTGDAVQCALTKEVHTQHCKLNKATDESALYGAEKGKEGSQIGDLPGNETIPFGPSSYDDSNALGAGACITDLAVNVWGVSVTLPLTMICPYLLWFRWALLAFASIAWLVIVFRK